MHPRWLGGDSDNCQILDPEGEQLRKRNRNYSNHEAVVGVAPVQFIWKLTLKRVW